MTTAWVPLATITADGSTATWDITDIPSSYRDLILVIDCEIASGTDNLDLRFNNDSTTNAYFSVYMEGDGSTASSNSGNTNFLRLTRGTRTSTTRSNFIVQIMDYSASDKDTTVLSRFNNATEETNAMASRWDNTTVIDEINVISGVNLVTGSTISLWGSNRV